MAKPEIEYFNSAEFVADVRHELDCPALRISILCYPEYGRPIMVVKAHDSRIGLDLEIEIPYSELSNMRQHPTVLVAERIMQSSLVAMRKHRSKNQADVRGEFRREVMGRYVPADDPLVPPVRRKRELAELPAGVRRQDRCDPQPEPAPFHFVPPGLWRLAKIGEVFTKALTVAPDVIVLSVFEAAQRDTDSGLCRFQRRNREAINIVTTNGVKLSMTLVQDVRRRAFAAKREEARIKERQRWPVQDQEEP